MQNDVNTKNIDALGRIVIPANIRKKLKINQNSIISFHLENDEIVLKKLHSLEEKNNDLLLTILEKLTKKDILIVDYEKVVASNIKKYVGNYLTNDFKKMLENRQKKFNLDLHIIEKEPIFPNVDIYPIIKSSILYGAIVIISKNIVIESYLSEIIENIVKLYVESCF